MSPYDLIKKYIQDSPNSLSDSNLSSDDQQHAHPSEEFSYSDDETPAMATRHFLPGPNGFKISGQKIQIYSDGSVTATDNTAANIRAYSLSESEEESDKEDDYDADTSVLESPRVSNKISEVPVKPPRRRSSEKDAARIGEDIERLQLQEASSAKASPSDDFMRTFPRSRKGSSRQSQESDRHMRKMSGGSQRSVTSRSRSFNNSRESLNLFGSVDFKNLGISKNFSSDVIREVYGSKTSLLKHLEQERKLRQLELHHQEAAAAGVETRETSVHDLLSKSTDSVLTSSSRTNTDGNRVFSNHSGKKCWKQYH